MGARFLAPDALHATNPQWSYGISWPDAANTVTAHSAMTLTDASGIGAKTWTFNTGGAAWQIGLASRFTQLASAGGAMLHDDYYTWSQDPAGHPYISADTSISDEGTGSQQSALSTQTLDGYGNVTQSAIYPYNNTSSPLQTYNNTYVVSSTFNPYYIFNLLATSTVTAGGTTITLAANSYIGFCAAACGQTVPTAEYDANSPVPWPSRATLQTSATNVKSTFYTYYPWGAVAQMTASDGSTATASADSATNYAVPQTISVQTYNQTISYNAWLGVTSQTGPNGQQQTMTYDGYGRPSTATSPYGAVTNYSYNTAAPFTQTETGPNGVTTTTLDGFGRPVLVARGDTSGVHSYTANVYAPCACSPLGKVQQVSQPYQSGGSASNWTTYTWDGLGRTVSVRQPDGASTTTYSYSGNQTTVTDPAGKSKQFTKDVLGNLTAVVEPDPANPPSGTLTTSYTYDWMNHVTQVSMPRGASPNTTTQTRTFVYNTAGLLTSATNPENGTVTYTYSGDNTLHYKQDAKGQATAYTYDTLKHVIETQQYPSGLSGAEDICGRMTYVWGTDPTNVYDYGRLAQVKSYAPSYGSPAGCGWANAHYGFYNSGTATDAYVEWYLYDIPGSVVSKTFGLQRAFPDGSQGGAGVGVNYAYDTAGRLATVTYPMTFTDSQGNQPLLTMAYDTMGRPSTLADSNNTYWVSGEQYDYAGRMTSLNYLTGYGSGSQAAASEARTYNANTGQLASLAWSGAGVWGLVQYAYSATQNNGQITQATDTVSGETIAYQYDALKRLTSASSTPINGSTPTAWTQTYQYDGFGNLTAKVLNGTTTPIPVNAATNQLSNASYDLNGNMISGAGATLTYDDANRMATASETSGGQEYYGYDASNKRVYRVMASGQEQITVYGAYGEKLGVYGIQAGSCNYSYGYGSSPCVTGFTPLSTSIWFAGRLIMDSGNGVVQDRLGTNRASGARFYPYGDEITSTNNDREKFATYTRDSYTGLDYADQRFYASTYGRFNTPDPYQASGGPSDPGSWNRYAYTRGDPINRVDPGGTEDCDPTTQFDCLTGYYCPPENGSCSYIASNQCPDASLAMALADSPDAATFWAQAQAIGCTPYSAQIIPVAAPAAPQQPQCFAQLKDRPVDDPRAPFIDAQHSFWYVEGSNGQQEIISGGPGFPSGAPPTGYLNVFIGLGTVSGPNSAGNNTVWSTGLSSSVCSQVNALESAASMFPNNTITYSYSGLNSNSLAHYLALAGGLNVSLPNSPYSLFGGPLYGWNLRIVFGNPGKSPVPPGRGTP